MCIRDRDYTGLASEQMKDNVAWNLLTVSSNGYTLISMVGKQIIDYYEEPIAVKSYDGDEIYNVISSSSAQITLMSYPASYLLVVSDTDSVSAEMLAKNLNVDYSIEYVENNKFKHKEFLAVSLDVLPDNILKISLQAIGVAISKSSDFPFTCNFLATGEACLLYTSETAKKLKAENPDKEVFVLGELIHNAHVINELENLGIKTLYEIPQTGEGICVIRSHGESPEEMCIRDRLMLLLLFQMINFYKLLTARFL